MALSSSRLAELARQPELIAYEPQDDLFGLDRAAYLAFQNAAVARRFELLRDQVPVLTRLADATGIAAIERATQAAPLLLQHTVYKSYPISLIERGDFARLTRWLGGLTSHDLSGVDTDGIALIDDWLQRLDETTPLRVVHSTGTSGKLSFIPRSVDEMPAFAAAMLAFAGGYGDEPRIDARTAAMVIPAYRHGFNAGPRSTAVLIEALGIPERDVLALHDRMSADLMSLSGRLRIAEAKGEAGRLVMNAGMAALRERLIAGRVDDEAAFAAFLTAAAGRFGGRRVWISSTVPQLYRAAAVGRSLGLGGIFASDSIVTLGGGLKGETLPGDFRQVIGDFLGVPTLRDAYGMTELMSFLPVCPHGLYHVPPQVVPYVVDPDTGAELPASGIQRGRFGFIDLLAISYWGGFLTGDEVTLDWQHSCPCGRSGGPVLHNDVVRLSATRGGDDKISCAGGADAAHDRAVAFLLDDAR